MKTTKYHPLFLSLLLPLSAVAALCIDLFPSFKPGVNWQKCRLHEISPSAGIRYIIPVMIL